MANTCTFTNLISTAVMAARRAAESGSEVKEVAEVSSIAVDGWETFRGDPEVTGVRNLRRFVVQSIEGLC